MKARRKIETLINVVSAAYDQENTSWVFFALLLWLRRRFCLVCFHRAVVEALLHALCTLCTLSCCFLTCVEAVEARASWTWWKPKPLWLHVYPGPHSCILALALCWLYYVLACISYSADLFTFSVFQSKSPTLGSWTKHCIVFKSESQQTDQSPTLQQK